MHQMRVLRVATLWLTVLFLVVPVANAADARRFTVETLRADFYLPTDKPDVHKWIGLSAERTTNHQTGKVTITGYPFKGRCEGDSSGYGLSCSGAGVAGWRSRFEADPAMDSGGVVLKKGKRRIELRFMGGQPFSITSEPSPNGCGGTTADSYPVARNATAEGRLFGRDVSTATEVDGLRTAESMVVKERTKTCA